MGVANIPVPSPMPARRPTYTCHIYWNLQNVHFYKKKLKNFSQQGCMWSKLAYQSEKG